MSEDLSSKTLCVVDRGLFTSWATKLSESFGRVLLFVDWKDAFPKSNKFSIGEGLPGVEKVTDLFDVINEVDVFAFFDIYDGDLQEHLRSLGKPVWGSGHGDELELDRWGTKKLLKELGLPVQHCANIIGLEALREYLRENEDCYVKISLLRGDAETWHHVRYELSEPRLDELEHRLAARKHSKSFLVEDAIHGMVSDIAFDGFSVNGMYPSKCLMGIEEKDKGYIGSVLPYSQFPKPIREVNEMLAPVLAHYGYKNFFSPEVIIGTKGEPFLIDPCMRCGSPPSELYQEMVSNWPEVIWNGAHGELVEPKWIARYGVEVLLHSSWADQNDEAVYFPKETERWVKLRNAARLEDRWMVMPQSTGLPEIGACVAIGNTIAEAVTNLKRHVDSIEGYDITAYTDSLLDILNSIRKAQEKGIRFTSDPLPSQAQIEKIIS